MFLSIQFRLLLSCFRQLLPFMVTGIVRPVTSDRWEIQVLISFELLCVENEKCLQYSLFYRVHLLVYCLMYHLHC